MKKINLLIFLILFCHMLYAQTDPIPDYTTELIKFYLQAEEFELVISYADSALQEGYFSDSLYYFKGQALEQKSLLKQAAQNYGLALQYSQDNSFLKHVTNRYKDLLFSLPALQAIEVHTNLIEELHEKQKYRNFLIIMAELYEYNQLYGEANDVYRMLIREEQQIDADSILIRIAKNQIFQKQFSRAMNTLENVIVQADSTTTGEALFYYYMSSHSNDSLSVARKTLIELYKDYPDHPKRREILEALADIFLKENPVLSWYFLDELFLISDDAEKIMIIEKIEAIKEELEQDKFTIGQFRELKLNFSDVSITEDIKNSRKSNR